MSTKPGLVSLTGMAEHSFLREEDVGVDPSQPGSERAKEQDDRLIRLLDGRGDRHLHLLKKLIDEPDETDDAIGELSDYIDQDLSRALATYERCYRILLEANDKQLDNLELFKTLAVATLRVIVDNSQNLDLFLASQIDFLWSLEALEGNLAREISQLAFIKHPAPGPETSRKAKKKKNDWHQIGFFNACYICCEDMEQVGNLADFVAKNLEAFAHSDFLSSVAFSDLFKNYLRENERGKLMSLARAAYPNETEIAKMHEHAQTSPGCVTDCTNSQTQMTQIAPGLTELMEKRKRGETFSDTEMQAQGRELWTECLQLFRSQDVLWKHAYTALCELLEMWHASHVDSDNFAFAGAFCEVLLDTIDKGAVQVLPEFRNLLVGRLLDYQVRAGKTDEALVLHARGRHTEEVPAHGLGVLAVVKAWLKCREEGMEGLDDLLSEEKLKNYVMTNLEQFVDSEWEEELWELFLKDNLCERVFQVYGYAEIEPRLKYHFGEQAEKYARAILMTKVHFQDARGLKALIKDVAEQGEDQLVAAALRLLDEQMAYAELIDLAQTVKSIRNNEKQAKVVMGVLFKIAAFNQDHYDLALELLGNHENLKARFAESLEAKRIELGIEEERHFSDMELVQRLLDAGNLPGGQDIERTAFVLSSVGKLTDEYREFLADLPGDTLCGKHRVEGGPLKDTFGILGFEVSKKEEGRIELKILLKNEENKVDKHYCTLVLDKALNVVWSKEAIDLCGDSAVAVAMRSLELCLLEEMVNMAFAFNEHRSREAISGSDAVAWEAFRTNLATAKAAAVNTLAGRAAGVEAKLEAMPDGIAARNIAVVKMMEQDLEEWQKHPNYPGREEVMALMTNFIEVLRTTRSLEPAVRHYRQAVNPRHPAQRTLKFVDIHGRRSGERVLTEGGEDVDKLREEGFLPEGKAQIAGVYQIYGYFAERAVGDELQALTVLFDEAGNCRIPGLASDHPLHAQIGLLVLEAAVNRLAPAMRPFFKFLGVQKDKSSTRLAARNVRVPVFDNGGSGYGNLVMAMIVNADRAGRGGAPEAYLADKMWLLQQIANTVQTAELKNLCVEDWPLYYKAIDGMYRDVTGLFYLAENAAVLLDKAKVMEVLQQARNARTTLDEEELQKMTEGEEKLTWGGLSEKCKMALLDRLRLKISSGLGGQGYRLPIHLVDASVDEVSNEVEALICINGKYMKAVQSQMTARQREIYEECSAINLDFSPISSTYAAIIDPENDKILGWYFVGESTNISAEDEVGIRARLRRNLDVIRKLESAGLSFDNLAVEGFAVQCNVGWRQGTFPKLTNFLSHGGEKTAEEDAPAVDLDLSTENLEEAIMRRLRQTLNHLSNEEFEELRATLKRLEFSAEDAERIFDQTTPFQIKRKTNQIYQDLQMAARANSGRNRRSNQAEIELEMIQLYRLSSEGVSVAREGRAARQVPPVLVGKQFRILHPKHPLYAFYAQSFSGHRGLNRALVIYEEKGQQRITVVYPEYIEKVS